MPGYLEETTGVVETVLVNAVNVTLVHSVVCHYTSEYFPEEGLW